LQASPSPLDDRCSAGDRSLPCTPVAAPEFRPGRINIDTGAFESSIALVLEGEARRILSA
jgi:hypothetical protein